MVECAALEMQYTGNRIEGSNPSLSATIVRYAPEKLKAFTSSQRPAPQFFPQRDNSNASHQVRLIMIVAGGFCKKMRETRRRIESGLKCCDLLH